MMGSEAAEKALPEPPAAKAVSGSTAAAALDDAREPHDPHYLRDVTALGDACELRTSRAIWSKNNRIKLVEKGVRVDSSLYDRLMQHKLKPPIEDCLTMPDAVSSRQVRDEAAKLLESRTGFGLLNSDTARPRDVLAAIAKAPIDDPLAVRLTVMRERRPKMLAHSIGVALLAASLARRAGLTGERLASIAGAGLYHDIGEMHTDAGLLAATRPLTEAERRHIFSHPLTAFLVLHERPSCAGTLAEAVFEHHERLDGSGYPRGIHGEEISIGGRITAIAELAATFFAQPSEAGALRNLQVVLKLNHRAFDRSLTNFLSELTRESAPAAAAGDAQVRGALEAVRVIQEGCMEWNALMAGTRESSAPQDWVDKRVSPLERSLLEVGLDPVNAAQLSAVIAEDPAARNELPALARELKWMMSDLLRGLYRRNDMPQSGPLFEWAESLRRRLGLA